MHKTQIAHKKKGTCILPINRPTKNMLMDAVDANPLETLLTKFNIQKKRKKKKKKKKKAETKNGCERAE